MYAANRTPRTPQMIDHVERAYLRKPAADVLVVVASIGDAFHPVVRPLDHLARL